MHRVIFSVTARTKEKHPELTVQGTVIRFLLSYHDMLCVIFTPETGGEEKEKKALCASLCLPKQASVSILVLEIKRAPHPQTKQKLEKGGRWGNRIGSR